MATWEMKSRLQSTSFSATLSNPFKLLDYSDGFLNVHLCQGISVA